MDKLVEAYKKANELSMGITYLEFLNNEDYHKNIYYDKWGFSWKFNRENELMYSDSHYLSKKKDWEYANMEGSDLPYRKFLTLEEFETVKPFYL